MGDRRSCLARRSLVVGALGAFAFAGRAAAQRQDAPVYVLSRSRLLNESEPTRILRRAEADLTARLQAEIDRTKAMLAKEEAELTRLRDELAPEEMARRAADFDARVRLARRQAQERANTVQTAFQEARAELVLALPPILEELRIEVGAVAILNADQTVAIAPDHDLTDKAIALFNARVPSPNVPQVDVTLELPAPAEPPAAAE